MMCWLHKIHCKQKTAAENKPLKKNTITNSTLSISSGECRIQHANVGFLLSLPKNKKFVGDLLNYGWLHMWCNIAVRKFCFWKARIWMHKYQVWFKVPPSQFFPWLDFINAFLIYSRAWPWSDKSSGFLKDVTQWIG